MEPIKNTYNQLVYQKTVRRGMDHEQHGCGNPADETVDVPSLVAAIPDTEPSEEASEAALFAAPVHHRIYAGGKVLKEIPGAGKVYDWRGTSWTRPMVVGSFRPIAFVQHIPVVASQPGYADFIVLRNVLVAQGLGVQFSTDKYGNVALYCDWDQMCYHARGANGFTVGCEHMHKTTGEAWTERQFRAAAWLVNQGIEKKKIPATAGHLAPGNRVCRVTKRGQVTHEDVSRKAGYFDRSDPGSGYSINHVRKLVMYYRDHNGSFEGAPSR